MTGQAALRWRQAALRNDDAELKKQFDRELENIVPEGVEAHVDHFLAMDQPDSILLAVVKVKGSLGTATAKRLLLPGFFFDTRSHQPFVDEEKRLEPVDMHYADRVTNVITYHLPAGITVEGAPQDTNISWPGHALFMVKSKADPGQIAISISLAGLHDRNRRNIKTCVGFTRRWRRRISRHWFWIFRPAAKSTEFERRLSELCRPGRALPARTRAAGHFPRTHFSFSNPLRRTSQWRSP